MITFVAILHVIVCIFLILVVLLQSGKSADLAGAFGGGGSQTALGARGAATFLGKMTTVAAIAFMVTAMTLAILKSKGESDSLIQDIPAAEETAEPEAQPAATDTEGAGDVSEPEADSEAESQAPAPEGGGNDSGTAEETGGP